MDRLRGKIALVTGAGSGIGRATALLFAREGAQVIAGVYEEGDAESIESAAVELPGEVEAAYGDVSTDAGAKGLVERAAERFGGLDILANNAGIVVTGDAVETTDEDWRRVLDVNAKGVWLCSKHAVPLMLDRGGGAIVNTASINAIRGNHRLVAYSASKGGVMAMTMAMALDYAPRNVRVNCVCPATIGGTRMVERALDQQRDRDLHLEYMLAKHPMGRIGKPDEVAYAILFLASDEASFITGVTAAHRRRSLHPLKCAIGSWTSAARGSRVS